MERFNSCRFELLEEVATPSNAQVWTSQYYYDGSGWLSLPHKDKLALKPTRFSDQRLLFLDPVDNVEEFTKVQSGKYDVKSWAKGKVAMGVEGDRRVFLKTPHLPDVAVYEHSARLPTFERTWKPLVFLVNEHLCVCRLTENLCLVQSKCQKGTINIRCIDYNGGFMCSHPATDQAIAYGCYADKSYFDGSINYAEIPKIMTSSGDWGFFLQFFKWGLLASPKSVQISHPALVSGILGMGQKQDVIGIIYHPPNLFLHVHIDCPAKTCRSAEIGKDYMLTCVKTSETDIDVYLVMDGQLMLYNYSFDIRINKPDKPKKHDHLLFKCQAVPTSTDKQNVPKTVPEGPAKFTFVNNKSVKVLVAQGAPLSANEHLVSSDVVGVFDAEICMYYTHPPALKHCQAFTTVATPVVE